MPTLPEDLVALLRAGQLEDDAVKYETGLVTLLPAGVLKVGLSPIDCQSTPIEEDDPHYHEMGCYLTPAVNLIVSRHKVAVLRLVS